MPTLVIPQRLYACTYSFADGRRCRTPRMRGHYFCYDHARKEAQSQAAEKIGRELAPLVPDGYLTACDLTPALARLFTAVAQDHIKPKAATTLANLGQTLLKSIQMAEHEYKSAYGEEAWREVIRRFYNAGPDAKPAPEPPAPPQIAPAPESAPLAKTEKTEDAAATRLAPPDSAPPVLPPAAPETNSQVASPSQVAAPRKPRRRTSKRESPNVGDAPGAPPTTGSLAPDTP